jgi:hypothetical protein
MTKLYDVVISRRFAKKKSIKLLEWCLDKHFFRFRIEPSKNYTLGHYQLVSIFLYGISQENLDHLVDDFIDVILNQNGTIKKVAASPAE